jgi:hypothetical protein
MTKEEATEFARKVYMTMPEEFEKARVQLFTCRCPWGNRVCLGAQRDGAYSMALFFIDDTPMTPKEIAVELLDLNDFYPLLNPYSVTW